MHIIKLNAIDSTNSYLKSLALKKNMENFTVVVAEHQFKGRGQRGASWVSEEGKNLTFSMLINFQNFQTADQFYLSMAVSLGILETVKTTVKNETSIQIKWPNDILADKYKLAGILIENKIRSEYIQQSVIGIGLNVNQKKFPDDIRRVTSLKKISDNHFDRDKLLVKIVNSIKKYVGWLEQKNYKKLKEKYLSELYKYRIPVMFEDQQQSVFLGKIVNVAHEGTLEIELEDETVRHFNLKEIKFADHS